MPKNETVKLFLSCLVFFIFGLFIGFLKQPVEKIDNFIIDGKIVESIKNRDKLPYGYKMETNGNEFAFVDNDNRRSLFSETSVDKAIKAAWSYYEYKKKKETESWQPFDGNKN